MLKCIHRRGEGSLLCGTVCCDVHEAALSGCYVNISSLTVFSLVLRRRSWAYKLNEIAIKTKLSAQWYTGMFKAFAKQSTTFQPMKAVHKSGRCYPSSKDSLRGLVKKQCWLLSLLCAFFEPGKTMPRLLQLAPVHATGCVCLVVSLPPTLTATTCHSAHMQQPQRCGACVEWALRSSA